MSQDTELEAVSAEQPVELTAEQKRIRRARLAQLAVSVAQQGQWDNALRVNTEILRMFPEDPEANNRVGNALSQLNRIDDAIAAYERTLDAQPTNPIAQRNLSRLKRIAEAGQTVVSPAQKLQPSFFIEEIGKTGVTQLVNIANSNTIARVSAGAELKLAESEGGLHVTTLDGVKLGEVESALGERLVRLISGGNEYQAGVVMAEPGRVRILIRETRKSPEQEGKISFPPRRADVRAYTRDSLIRRHGDEDDELEGEVEASDVDDIEEEDETSADYGFGDSSSDDGH
jgi:hypothetical protein